MLLQTRSALRLLIAFLFIFLTCHAQLSHRCEEALDNLPKDTESALQMLQGCGKYPGDWGYFDSCRLAANAQYTMNRVTVNITALLSEFNRNVASSQQATGLLTVSVPKQLRFLLSDYLSLQQVLTEQGVTSEDFPSTTIEPTTGIPINYGKVLHTSNEPRQASPPGQNKSATISEDWGLCLPSACDATDVKVLLQMLAKESRGILLQAPIETKVITREELTPGAIVMIFLLCLLFALLVAGTGLDYVKNHMKGTFRQRLKAFLHPAWFTTDSTFEPLEEDEDEPKQANAAHTSTCSLSGFLLCWSAIYNLEKLLAPTPDRSLSLLNGMRTLSMAWIILGHTLLYIQRLGMDNFFYLIHEMQTQWTWQLVAAAPLAVDTFFFISAFLLGFLGLKEMKKTSGRFNWFLYYFHRVWRLSPLYFFLLFIHWQLGPFTAFGPKSHVVLSSENCDHYWWTDLLYIQNFYPVGLHNACMGWSWYLANDMQFYILTPLVLYPFHRWIVKRWKKDGSNSELRVGEIIAWCILGLFMIGCIGATIGVIIDYDMDSWYFSPNQTINTQYYTRPYVRALPYLIGLAFAFMMTHDRVAKARPHPLITTAMLGLALAIMMACIFPGYQLWHDSTLGQRGVWNMAQNVFSLTFSRAGWTVALCLMTYICAVGDGGVLQWMLGHDFWTPLARLTYCAYLIHPIIILPYVGNMARKYSYSIWNYSISYVACLLLAYLMAGVFFLLLERPLMNLERLLLSLFSRKRPSALEKPASPRQPKPYQVNESEKDKKELEDSGDEEDQQIIEDSYEERSSLLAATPSRPDVHLQYT